jgi:hypothetical protein
MSPAMPRLALFSLLLALSVLPGAAQVPADTALPAAWPSACGDPAPPPFPPAPRDAPAFRLPDGVGTAPGAARATYLGLVVDRVLASRRTRQRVRAKRRDDGFPRTLDGPADTLYHRREQRLLVVAGGDTLRLEERYRRGRYWTLERFRRDGGAWDPVGGQWRFNEQGQPIEQLWCAPGERDCPLWRRVAWWPGGVPAREGAFRDGRPTGLHRAWYPDGTLRACLAYADGRLRAVHGLWGPSGETLPTGSFTDGDGSVIRYSLQGTPLGENRFRDGKRMGYRALDR